MEKKTMGSFIAVLRKARGMTQRELAEKLNVSDKSVSRWERDETYPDLTLIPIIAELFGVTADELLKGQRINAEKSENENSSTTEISRKNIEKLLKIELSRLKSRTIISFGLILISVIAFFVCTLAFDMIILGAGIGCCFIVSAVLCQIIFSMNAKTAAADTDFECETISDFRFSVLRYLFAVIYTVIFTVLCSVALVAVGIISLPLTLLLSSVICVIISFVKDAFIKKSSEYNLNENRKYNLKLKRKLTLIASIAFVLLIIAEVIVNSINPLQTAKKTRFENKEDFINCMQTNTGEFICSKFTWGIFSARMLRFDINGDTDYDTENQAEETDSYSVASGFSSYNYNYFDILFNLPFDRNAFNPIYSPLEIFRQHYFMENIRSLTCYLDNGATRFRIKNGTFAYISFAPDVNGEYDLYAIKWDDLAFSSTALLLTADIIIILLNADIAVFAVLYYVKRKRVWLTK